MIGLLGIKLCSASVGRPARHLGSPASASSDLSLYRLMALCNRTEKRRMNPVTTTNTPTIQTWTLVGMSLTLGIAIATSFAMSACNQNFSRTKDLHILNATTSSTQSIPVMMDVLRISTYRRLLLRRWEVGRCRCVWVSDSSVHSASVCVHNGDLFATASGTSTSVSVSASGIANASLLMIDEHLIDSTE